MTAGEAPPGTDALREGVHKANALVALLDEEFTLLKAGDLESFEALQAKKSETLEALSTLMPVLTGEISLAEEEDKTDDHETASALVDEIKGLLATCRDAHLKNAMLIDRKIEATRSALEVLRSSRSADTGETYDKLGKLKRGHTRGRQTDV
jgi:flagellar biosynthesis/type III secretory pathway chaperone